jgi:hypothetical protein
MTPSTFPPLTGHPEDRQNDDKEAPQKTALGHRKSGKAHLLQAIAALDPGQISVKT